MITCDSELWVSMAKQICSGQVVTLLVESGSRMWTLFKALTHQAEIATTKDDCVVASRRLYLGQKAAFEHVHSGPVSKEIGELSISTGNGSLHSTFIKGNSKLALQIGYTNLKESSACLPFWISCWLLSSFQSSHVVKTICILECSGVHFPKVSLVNYGRKQCSL